MINSVGDIREGFICPQCHQDMSTKEMLQMHFQDVHMKQSSSTVKGLFSLAKQKIKSVQDNFTTLPNEQINNYSQYFSYEPTDSSFEQKQQTIGYICSHNSLFQKYRKDRLDNMSIKTTELLLRLEPLISCGENIPKHGNTKERRKYEQDIVEWVDDSRVSLCPSCTRQFGLSRRKHHCRLDGFVICDPCSRFLPFSIARFLLQPNTTTKITSNGVTLARSNSLTSLNSTTGADDSNSKNGMNQEDYLRICLTCRDILQKRYDQICFKNTDKDQVFLLYEKIVTIQKELKDIHPKYTSIIDSLLSGDTKHQIIDAQQLHRRLTSNFEKIDSISKSVIKLSESCPNIDENDTATQIRYAAFCRNVRMYAVYLLQNYTISTRRVPTEEDVKQAREERKRLIEEQNEFQRATRAELAGKMGSTELPGKTKNDVTGWRPTIDRNILVQAEELNPLVQQVYQVTEYIRQAEIAGRHDEVELLKQNLKELEQALNSISLEEKTSANDSQ